MFRFGLAVEAGLGRAGYGKARQGLAVMLCCDEARAVRQRSQGTASQAMVECGLSGLVTAGFSELPIMTAH